MIGTLEELKRVLGLDLEATDEDANLTRILEAKTTWVEGATQRRFDAPIAHVQYTDGNGDDAIYLEWHAEPDVEIHVYRRPRIERNRPWEELIEGTDWERRDQKLLFLRVWQVWDECDEYKVTYDGGYPDDKTPADIKELVLSLATYQYLSDNQVTGATAGITSESIGDYSYSATLPEKVDAVAGMIGDNGMKVLNRYKRRFV